MIKHFNTSVEWSNWATKNGLSVIVQRYDEKGQVIRGGEYEPGSNFIARLGYKTLGIFDPVAGSGFIASSPDEFFEYQRTKVFTENEETDTVTETYSDYEEWCNDAINQGCFIDETDDFMIKAYANVKNFNQNSQMWEPSQKIYGTFDKQTNEGYLNSR